jgi:hypothetical protein
VPEMCVVSKIWNNVPEMCVVVFSSEIIFGTLACGSFATLGPSSAIVEKSDVAVEVQ